MQYSSLCALSIFFMLAGGASAKVIHVDRSISPTTVDGASWATAYPTIYEAIAAADYGDEIWVAAGVYSSGGRIDKPIALYGGFVGTESYRDQRPGLPSLTVIDAQYQSVGISVEFGLATSPPATVDGFTIRNGRTNESGRGAGVNLLAGNLRLTHNIVIGNYADPSRLDGSAVFCRSGTAALIAGNIITANTARLGSAIYSVGGQTAVVNNTIVGNSGAGGAVVVDNVYNAPPQPFANNIIAFNETGLGGSNTYPLFHHNCVFGNYGGNYMFTPEPTGSGNISADPKFADYSTGNLHLQPDSPCRDAGDDSVAAPNDLDVDLQPRVQDAHADIGADESDGRRWLPTPLRVFHVMEQSGSDDRDGLTWQTAMRTVAAAARAAAASGGGEVWVAAGRYGAGSDAAPPLGTTHGLAPYVYLYGGFAGTETARDQRNWAAHMAFLGGTKPVVGSAVGVRVSAIDGFVFYQPAVQSQKVLCIQCSGGSPYIRNNVFMNNNGAVSMLASAAVLDNNAIVGGTTTVPSAVDAQQSVPTIVNNRVTGNHVTGGSSPSAIRMRNCPAGRIANNLIDSNGAAPASSAYAPLSLESSGVDVVNNTLVNNQGTGIRLQTKIRSSVMNNIVAFSDRFIYLELASPFVTARGNCLYAVTSLVLPPILAGGGNLLADPQFADLLNEDYHLRPTSPCVDFGDDSAVLPGEMDLDGFPRIMGLHVDAGCYESSGTGTERRWSDVASVLRIAGGLDAASSAQANAYGAGGTGLTIQDAIALARALNALSR